jgi:hypothetical protein
MIVLISDFYEAPTAVLDALKPLRARGHDLMVFQVLDRDEIEFPFTGSTQFEDLETGVRMPIVSESVRDRYRTAIQAHLDELSKLFRESRIDYYLVNTSQPLDFALFDFLSTRERLNRVR